ncbi:hypothetical protein BDV97DRAFT_372153 [Delphinella strobiligena]|nr:hypothetical protein BDV97DRAFT_372153 [Delphinella strobiligena]
MDSTKKAIITALARAKHTRERLFVSRCWREKARNDGDSCGTHRTTIESEDLWPVFGTISYDATKKWPEDTRKCEYRRNNSATLARFLMRDYLTCNGRNERVDPRVPDTLEGTQNDTSVYLSKVMIDLLEPHAIETTTNMGSKSRMRTFRPKVSETLANVVRKPVVSRDENSRHIQLPFVTWLTIGGASQSLTPTLRYWSPKWYQYSELQS